MFRGISMAALDTKGRLSMPSRYRQAVHERCQGQLVITVDQDGCLLLYPRPDWEVVEQRLVSLSSVDRGARLLKRLLIGHAEDCQMDNQGRFLISPPLREFAGLDKRIALVGQGNKFEIWDEQAWQKLKEGWLDTDVADHVSDELARLSF